jgi:hypothetical protein
MQLTVPIPAMFLAAFLTISALGQQPNTYAELRAALGLTDFQIDHLQRLKTSAHPASQKQLHQEKDAARELALAVLTPEQRERLATMARVLNKTGTAGRLIRMGALTCGEWPPGCGCVCGGIDADKTFELVDAQRARLEEVRTAAMKVPREAVIAILNDSQRASLSVFDKNLRVAKQAIQIGLIPAPPPRGECLCN